MPGAVRGPHPGRLDSTSLKRWISACAWSPVPRPDWAEHARTDSPVTAGRSSAQADGDRHRHVGALVMDVDDDRSVKAGMGEVMTEYGQVDALVTAAGWGLSGSVEDTAIPLAKAQLETNFWGTVRVVREVLPACAVVVADGSF